MSFAKEREWGGVKREETRDGEELRELRERELFSLSPPL
jgi:hypothetical protein